MRRFGRFNRPNRLVRLNKFNRNRIFHTVFFTAIILLVIIVAVFIFINKQVAPLLGTVLETRGKSVASKVIDETVLEVIKNPEYGNLLEFRENGGVTALNSNTVKINQLKSELALRIQTALNDSEELSAEVPIGNLLDYTYFLGRGPKIKIRMFPVGYSQINIEDSFTYAGINQTKYELNLTVVTKLSVLTNMVDRDIVVETKMPIANTIIVGNVPDTYADIELQR